MGQLGTWSRSTFRGAEVQLAAVLAETAEEYRLVHARLAYRAMFEAETGVQLPSRAQLAELLVRLGLGVYGLQGLGFSVRGLL